MIDNIERIVKDLEENNYGKIIKFEGGQETYTAYSHCGKFEIPISGNVKSVKSKVPIARAFTMLWHELGDEMA